MKMATRARRADVGRQRLTRERVLQAAVNLADREGMESLSMRRLGQELGVEAMSLYNHVRNKDDVLDGMVDIVFGEVDLPGDGGHWKTTMRHRAISARQALRRHPWAIGLMESRAQPGPASLRHHNAMLGSLREAGFSVEVAGHAYSILDSYIYGFTLNERSLPSETAEEFAEAGRNFLRELPANEYPYLIEFLIERAMKPGYRYGDEFEFGLELILDALERVRES
jgi:AcrR family transcriptional regulator